MKNRSLPSFDKSSSSLKTTLDRTMLSSSIFGSLLFVLADIFQSCPYYLLECGINPWHWFGIFARFFRRVQKRRTIVRFVQLVGQHDVIGAGFSRAYAKEASNFCAGRAAFDAGDIHIKNVITIFRFGIRHQLGLCIAIYRDGIELGVLELQDEIIAHLIQFLRAVIFDKRYSDASYAWVLAWNLRGRDWGALPFP